MEHQFTDSGVKAIVIAENFASNLEKILHKTDIKTIITTSIGEMLGGVKGAITDFAVKKIKKMVPKYNLPNTVKFKEALSQGKKFSINADFETFATKHLVKNIDECMCLKFPLLQLSC